MTLEEDIGMLLVTLLGVMIVGFALASLLALLRHLLRRQRLSRRERWTVPIGLGLGLAGLGCFLYAALVEVDRLEVTRHELKTPALGAGERIRIVHLSDLHIDRQTPVLQALPRLVRELQPDLVLFTGDALNDRRARPRFQALLRELEARDGRFAVRGNFDAGDDALFEGGAARELRGEPVVVSRGRLTLCGTGIGGGRADAIRACLRSAKGLRLIAYHTPDLIEELAPEGADLYLAGHTHGGQVRLPLYGAVLTLSRFGKRYEIGRHLVGKTQLIVNRGIGMEPPPAPRVRFLCSPEVVVIDWVGDRGAEPRIQSGRKQPSRRLPLPRGSALIVPSVFSMVPGAFEVSSWTENHAR